MKPFELLANQISFQDEKLDEFWASLRKAEEGEATDFIEQLNYWISEASSEVDSDLGDDASPPAGT